MLLALACTEPEPSFHHAKADSGVVGSTDSAEESPPPPGTLGTLRSDGAARLDTVATVNYRGVDAARDEASGTFVVAYGNAPIGGAIVDAQGAQVGAGFLIADAYTGANWSQNPRVVSTSTGVLVSWHQDQGAGPTVAVRAMRVVGGAPTFDHAEVTLSSPGSSQESPASMAWSPERSAALVVWAQDGLHAVRVGADGSALGTEVQLTEAGVWVEMPSVAWSPGCDCWLVSVMQAPDTAAHVLLLRVDGATGAARGATTDLTGALEFAKVTELTADEATGDVIASWYQVTGGAAAFGAVDLDADGAVIGAPRTIFAPYGSYDGYDLSWSPVTGSSLGVFHGSDVSALAEELAKDLSDGDARALDTTGASSGVYLPRVVADPTAPAWLVFASPDYAGVSVERIVHD